MSKEDTKVKDTTAESGKPGPDGIASDTQTSTPNQTPDNNKPAPEMVSKEEMLAAVERARKQEKEKVYPELKKLKEDKAANDKRMAELQKTIDDLRSGESKVLDSVNAEMKTLREANSKLEDAIHNVANDAAAKILQSELKAYREKKLRESGITELQDFVTGDSEEAIDASVKAVKEKEMAISKAALDAAKTAQAKNLPKPLVVDSTGTTGPSVLRPQDKEVIARLPETEYRKRRDELLKNAKKKAGIQI